VVASAARGAFVPGRIARHRRESAGWSQPAFSEGVAAKAAL